MTSTGATPTAEKLHLSDEELDEDLWASPSRATSKKSSHGAKSSVSGFGSSDSRHEETAFEKEESRTEALRKELESVRKVNSAIEGVIESLTKAKANMSSVNQTVGAASSLLNTWTSILSQTEHNQRLILNPAWQGASQDIADEEQEALARQQAAERREIEELQRREAATRKAEEDERKRAEAATKATRGAARGRVRGTARGGNVGSTSTGYVGVGGQTPSRNARGTSTATRRTAGGIGRGIGSVRSRGRG